LMTAFAFILGCVPLWAASGAGAISRRVLGIAVIGGMLAASVLAIFLIPVSFDVVERIAHRGKAKVTPSPLKPPATACGAYEVQLLAASHRFDISGRLYRRTQLQAAEGRHALCLPRCRSTGSIAERALFSRRKVVECLPGPAITTIDPHGSGRKLRRADCCRSRIAGASLTGNNPRRSIPDHISGSERQQRTHPADGTAPERKYQRHCRQPLVVLGA